MIATWVIRVKPISNSEFMGLSLSTAVIICVPSNLLDSGSQGTSHESDAASHILFLKIKILLANIWWGSWCWCQEVDITMCRVSQSCHLITAICKHSGWCEHFAGMEFWPTLFIRMIQRFSSAVQLLVSRAWRNVTFLHSGSALIHLMDVVKEWEFLIT